MKPSEFAKNQLEFLIRRKALCDAISSEQEKDLMLAEAYLRLREAAEDVTGDGVIYLNENADWDVTLDGVDKLILLEAALEETDD
jgi:hypothetical protein